MKFHITSTITSSTIFRIHRLREKRIFKNWEVKTVWFLLERKEFTCSLPELHCSLSHVELYMFTCFLLAYKCFWSRKHLSIMIQYISVWITCTSLLWPHILHGRLSVPLRDIAFCRSLNLEVFMFQYVWSPPCPPCACFPQCTHKGWHVRQTWLRDHLTVCRVVTN